MSNALTGDFDAVLQVSGSTVNRILAVMHQNAGLTTDLPTFPHSVRLRIGEPSAIEGIRGVVTAQVSVPRIELIHGSTDRFWLEIAIRARYRGDTGTTPLPEFINGTVRAQYRLDAIDPTCFGWSRLAADYLWVRVVGDTVSFSGTAVDDVNLVSLAPPLDETVARARITRLVTVLLETQFSATPHKVSSRFRRGSMRSLRVAANRSVVALPIGISGETPVGNINSINQDLLQGRDVGIGISADVIIARVQQKLDAFRAGFEPFTFGFQIDVHSEFAGVDVLDVKVIANWTMSLTGLSAQWLSGSIPFFDVSVGLIAISFAGQASAQPSTYNWDFDGTALILLTFDSGSQGLSFALIGTPAIHFHGPLGSTVQAHAKSKVEQRLKKEIQQAINQFAGLMTFGGQATELSTQVSTMVGPAVVQFDEAAFSPDGMIVRGQALLAPRRSPVHDFVTSVAEDDFNAVGSWLPGGRIDAFDWSWSWFNHGGERGSETHKDRFVLRRPAASGRSNFGVALGSRRPLPGLDGMGVVCLNVRGVQVHPVTGDLVPASTGRHCERFGIDITLPPAGLDRLFIREFAPKRDPIGPIEEVAVHRVDGRNPAAPMANVLVVFAGEQWNSETASALREGVAACRRRDAGLLVLVLFRDGTLTAKGAQFLGELREQLMGLEAPLVVNEDVHSSWSRALFVDGAANELTYRLVTPTGGYTWAYTGWIDGRSLAKALDDHLLPSAHAHITPIRSGPTVGTRVSSIVAGLRLVDIFAEMPCPPPPIGRLGTESVIVFAKKGSVASDAVLKQVVNEYKQGDHDRDMVVTVIVDGASLREIASLGLPAEFTIVPDTDGVLAKGVGIRTWPTRLAVNAGGIIVKREVGLEIQDRTTEAEQAS